MRPPRHFLQLHPIEPSTRIKFAAGRDMIMASHMIDGVCHSQRAAQFPKPLILSRLEQITFQAFKLDADRKIIAVIALSKARNACVPRPIVTTYKLPKLAAALNVEVRRHLHPTYLLIIRMRLPIKLIGKKLLHLRSAVTARRQADGVHHDQVHRHPGRAGPDVG